jgi:hypothetical protein
MVLGGRIKRGRESSHLCCSEVREEVREEARSGLGGKT